MAKDESTFALMKSYGAGILAAIILALLIRFFVIEAYRIPNDVMHPTLERGDIIFVSKMAYGLRHPTNSRKLTQGTRPKYGDVVTYFTQEDPFRHYIKRIVGLPGDTIELLNGQLILNGKKVKYSFLPGSNCGFEHHPSAEYRVCIEFCYKTRY